MKTIKALAAVAAVVALAGLAQAQTVTYSSSSTYSSGAGTYSQTATIGEFYPNSSSVELTFNSFNASAGQSLTSVTIESSLSTWGGSFTVLNLGGTPAASASVQFGTSVNLSSSTSYVLPSGVSPLTAYTSGSSGILAANGNSGDSYTLNGASAGSPAVSSSGPQSGTTFFYTKGNPFNSMGNTFNVNFVATGYSSYAGGNVQETINPQLAAGSVKVVYNYSGSPLPVPEPASVGLLVVGGLAVVLRRRFMKKA